MSKYKIKAVDSKELIREFHALPKRLYKGDKLWVEPLVNDIESRFDPAQNELLHNGEITRWVVRDEQGVVVGRIAAFWNRGLADANPQPTGGVGFFESIDDGAVAGLMFDTAREWLAARGMEAMDGPINFGDRGYWWGLLVKNDGGEPLYMNNYCPAYYEALFEGYGFRNYFNQYTYYRELVVGKLNPVSMERAEKLFVTPGYRFEKANRKPLPDYADDFREVYNRAWAKFTGVNPITTEHAQELLRTLRPIVDVRLLYFAYFEEQPIGFFIMVPDLNRITKKFGGRFGIIEKLRLMYELKVRKSCDRAQGMIFGVVPEFQGRGIESGLIRKFECEIELGQLPYKSLEMSWTGDFNPVMMRFVESYVCASVNKVHVTYRYLFDRDKEFARAPRMGREKPPRKTSDVQSHD